MRKSRDFVTAYELQQLPDNSAVMGHSGGSGDILDAMVVSAIQGGKTPIHIVALGSPEKKEDFIKVGKEVGVKSVVMVNDSRDPVSGILNNGEKESFANSAFKNAGLTGAMAGTTLGSSIGGAFGLIPGMVIGGAIGGIVGGAAISLGVSALRLEKYHSFESYFQNPEFQLQQTIQRLLIQDAMKEIKEKGLGDD